MRALRVDLPVRANQRPFLHPGRSAQLGQSGLLGEVHPLVAEEFGLDVAVAVFEIDLMELATPDVAPVYRDVITFPAVRQDIAVVVEDTVPAAEVVAVIRESGGELLTRAEVFDSYRGEQIGDGRHSIAIHLEFQAPDRTLTDADADAVRERIVAALGERLGAQLRAG